MGAQAHISATQLTDIRCRPMSALLVDEEAARQQIVSAYLQQVFDDIVIQSAEHIAEAFPFLSAHRFDVVLLRITPLNLHLLSDYVVTIGKVALDEHLPVIALSEELSEQQLRELLALGVADCLASSELSEASIYRSVRNAVEKGQLRRDNESKRVIIQQNNRELQIQKQHIGSFYETVSHELKSPLAGAREYISLVIDGVCGDANAEQKKLLYSALECCDSLKDLIHDLLDTAAMENGMLVLRYAPCAINQLVRKVIARYSPQAGNAGLSIRADIQCPVEFIDCDEMRLDQLLSHLISNAIKNSRANEDILVSLALAGDKYITLSVRDQGRGIPLEHQQRVFDKFYQIKDDTDNEFEHLPGMGLGLYLCRSIACLHGGHLGIQSTPGEGSAFTASIPITQHD